MTITTSSVLTDLSSGAFLRPLNRLRGHPGCGRWLTGITRTERRRTDMRQHGRPLCRHSLGAGTERRDQRCGHGSRLEPLRASKRRSTPSPKKRLGISSRRRWIASWLGRAKRRPSQYEGHPCVISGLGYPKATLGGSSAAAPRLRPGSILRLFNTYIITMPTIRAYGCYVDASWMPLIALKNLHSPA
jgi:hypothetical protein